MIVRLRRLAAMVAFLLVGSAAPAFASTFTVTTTADSGDGSLRDAIAQANVAPGPDTIAFAIVDVARPYVIALASDLPPITSPVVIDGTNGGVPGIELNGRGIPDGVGLTFSGASGGSTVRGLVIGGFSAAGILVESGGNTIAGNYIGSNGTAASANPNGNGVEIESGTANTIGGPNGADRNVISGNTGDAVYVGSSVDKTVVQGNYLGVDASGAAALGNGGRGVQLYGPNNIVRGNVIAANAPNIWIFNSSATGNTIAGNLIGTDATGAVGLGVGGGISLDNGASNNVIGGTNDGDANVISGTNGVGIAFAGATTTGNRVVGNWIGPQKAGGSAPSALGNGDAILFDGSTGNTIGGPSAAEGNVIAFNKGNAGIVLQNGARDRILGNAIYANDNLGIAYILGGAVTPNDAPDADGIQNYPVITSVTAGAVSGTIDSAPARALTIEVFTDSACDASGYGEGRTLLGRTDVTTDAAGHASFSIPISGALGAVVTTTATSSADTSEFSRCFSVPTGVGTTTGSTSSGSTTDTAPGTTTAAAGDGAGTVTTGVATVMAGSAGNTLTFTYTAGGPVTGGAVALTVPAGWNLPSTTATDRGYVTADKGTLSVSGSTILVDGLDLVGGATVTITYGAKSGGPGATAPTTVGPQTWQAQERSGAGGTLTDIASPAIAVTPPTSAPDSLVFSGPVSASVGGSARVLGAQLHLNSLPAKADIEIAIDTTGSMSASIAQARADATSLVNSVRAGIPDAQFSVVQFRDSGDTGDPGEYKVMQPLTDQAGLVQTAINGLAAGGGGDFPEAYNLVFHNSYTPATGGDIGWRSGSRKFVVVIGDAQPHGAGAAGIAGCTDLSTDPHGFNTATELAGMKANERTLFMIRQARTATVALSCYQSLAAGAYTGGQGVDGGTSLGAQIVGLVQQAASSIGSVALSSTTDGFTFAANAAIANLQAPVTDTFDGTVTVSPTVAPGTYDVTVAAVADGVPRATGTLRVTVVAPITNLAISASPTTTAAGLGQVPLLSIPNAWLSYYAGSTRSSPVGATPVGATPVGATPVGATPVGATPVGATPVGATPVGATPVGATPVGATGLFDMPVGATPVGATALSSILLSQITLNGVSWSQILCPSLLAKPLATVTLQDVQGSIETCGSDGKTSLDRLKALPLNKVDLTTTLLKSVHWATLLAGNTPLSALDGGFAAWCGTGGLIPANGGDCTGAGPSTTVLQLDVAGHLGSAPVGATPVGATPVGATPVGATPVGATRISASRLALIPLSSIASVTTLVNCSTPGLDCSTQTLGDAARLAAIRPTTTFADIADAMRAAGITINDLVVAILGANGIAWEQLPVQGLQPYAAAPKTVTYTVTATVDCSVARSFAITAALPQGFFPVNGSAKLALGGGAAAPAGDPTVLGESVGDAARLNSYRWSLGCGNVTASTVASFTVDAYVGLTLGTFSATAKASVGTFSVSATGGPVTVTQGGEPNDDPNAATTIQPDTLVVGHIGSSGDQDFYKVKLDGLARGSKVDVFLQVPQKTDLDLTISKPAAPSFFSSPVGATPVGATPIEDRGVGFGGTGLALPAETLQDVPVGATPVGATPVGATPVGSTSTNRGDANEAAEVITSSTSDGYATIGVSGYDGASASVPYVLRVQVTPPPALPVCPARPLAVSAGNQGTLPGSLPTSTKTLFIVNKQRLLAMYPTTNWQTFLNSLNSLAGRSEVAGSVLQVDGNAAVRAAYAAWDAQGGPCSVERANDVVRAINDVVASYRGAPGGLPNLHYVVILGGDEAVPMARTPDPVTLSPEVNEAADLAFTTSGLTQGNALYTSAATNNILTDGAYGAFGGVSWRGRELLLPEVSVARLVESPATISALVSQYIANRGQLTVASTFTSGYDFLADGASQVAANLAARFPTASASKLISEAWTKADVVNGFFNSPATLGSVNAHYNHYELQPAAGADLVTTAQVPASIPGRILFTMGCHGGLNVSDSLGGDAAKLKDWPQTYLASGAAIYIANTGFGYGDSASVALSERLLSLYAANIHSDASSVGEQWATTLQQYFATAGAYEDYDRKVLEETTFYGLPFWHFTTAGTSAAPAPLATTPDAATGTQSATVAFPAATVLQQDQYGLYRPVLPLRSQEVTSNLPARGVWILSLGTSDAAKPVTIGYPTIDLSSHEPKPSVRPIFFPANPFMLERSRAFGNERDYVNVSDQFRPDAPPATSGVQRHVTSASLEILYSTSADRTPPLISQVDVSFDGANALVEARVTDDFGAVAKVAALVNNGVWRRLDLTQSTQDPTLWTGSIATPTDPEVFVEATDGVNVAYSANKGSNFTSTNSAPPDGPKILIQAPVGPYGLNERVAATYSCGGAPTCTGTVPSGSTIDTSTPGLHTFTVTAIDTAGNSTTLQRSYVVTDLVLKASVSPTTATTGTRVLAQASLTNAASVRRDVTVSATFLYNTSFAVSTPPLAVSLAPGASFSGALPFVIPRGLPRGTYTVVLYATDSTGTVSARATLTVS